MPDDTLTCPQCGATDGFDVLYTSPPTFRCKNCGDLFSDPKEKGIPVYSGEEARKRRPEMYEDDE